MISSFVESDIFVVRPKNYSLSIYFVVFKVCHALCFSSGHCKSSFFKEFIKL